MTRRVHRAAAVLALAGVAFGALWPLVAQARSAPTPVPIMVCTAGAPPLAHLDAGGIPRPEALEHREHCALCLGATGPVAHMALAAVIDRIAAPSRIVAVVEDPPRPTLPFERPPSHAPPSLPAT